VSLPKVETVNVVTMEHGRKFAEEWFKVSMAEACGETEIMTWPEWDADQQASFRNMEDDICGRVFVAIREHVAETFVRIANAAIEEERVRPEEPLDPPRIETVEVVTPEHGLVFAEQIYQQTIDTEHFSEAFGRTEVMTWPDAEDNVYSDAQKHFHELSDEIRDRLHEETKQAIAEAFVRIAGDVISRERSR
jgi:hypothetical protein